MEATRWNPDVLAEIDEADDLEVSPLRADGRTFGTPTWVWEVAVDGELYVRAYNGTASRWYAAALIHPDGRIHSHGSTFDVTFVPVDADVAAIDAAYRVKYASSPYCKHMVSEVARAATLRLDPRDATV